MLDGDSALALKAERNCVNVLVTAVEPTLGRQSEGTLVYVVEILERCSSLAARTAQVYRRLAQRFQGDEDRIRLWRELALEEETHADILRRELQSFQEEDQSGSFLPDYADRLHQLDTDLRQLESRAAAARTLDDALAVAVALEQADLENLYDDLVLQGEPAFKLISERLEAALAARPEATPSAGMARRGRRDPS
jgi:hypothetical protein